MARRILSPSEAFDLRQTLHVATLQALMSSRRWTAGDLVFQGGTSLHLAHGSPRLSEDLDFLVKSSLKLNTIESAVLQRLQYNLALPEGASVSVKPAKDGRNPHSFMVVVGGENLIGGVHVKVELWKTEDQALGEVGVTVAPVRILNGANAGLQTFVPTAELSEIYADKVFALAARSYLKPRDVFDLHWLIRHHAIEGVTQEKLNVRLATYPNETAEGWLEKSFGRRAELRDAAPAIAKDLQRWLPPTWPMDERLAGEMASSAISALDQGIDVMRTIAVQHENDGYGR